ncbi:MAG: HAD family hydrolase [Candidatus Cryptobacteroides sp.]
MKDRLFIFDLDGTLIDSVLDLAAAGNHTLALHGFPTHPMDAYYGFVGNGIGKLMEKALPAEAAGRAEDYLDDFKAYYNSHLCDHTHPYPGVPELLAKIQESGAKLAVASNKYQQATQVLVDKLFPGIRFVAICGQREGVARKPSPEVVYEIASLTGTALEDVIYVGDSDVDMRTAANAGVKAVGVTYGFCSREVVESFRPWKVVDSASELQEFLVQTSI